MAPARSCWSRCTTASRSEWQFWRAPWERHEDGSINMTSLLIRGGRVIDPASGVDAVADVLLREGRVAQVGKVSRKGAGETFDARGLIVAPGFVELHVHLREP